VTALESRSDAAAAEKEFRSMHLRMPVVYDREGKVGAALGIFSDIFPLSVGRSPIQPDWSRPPQPSAIANVMHLSAV
jgi:hypothetical protein